MPLKSAKQFGLAGAVLGGKSDAMPVSVAREMMRKTPVKKRKRFAKANAKKRAKRERVRTLADELLDGR
jgi:hypothetical protein